MAEILNINFSSDQRADRLPVLAHKVAGSLSRRMTQVIPERFQAFVAEKKEDGVVREVRELAQGDLDQGDVTIAVSWSSVNYKDALATIAGSKVARRSPLVPGVDLAGTVVELRSCGLAIGTAVLVHGYDLGVSQHGGFSQYARVPAEWVVPLPSGLTERQAMILGTAGFTAALSVHLLQSRAGLHPEAGPVLVTGATGGVGSIALNILAGSGYEVVASTGKAESAKWLRSLGAAEVITREETTP
ncbi:MAG: alcohol dehydrogenase catalytic domain-containing protein, partial [Actinobacteria bacterium]|nr:alcohol dehydrogenase catalytic domain-containing protein [Actinomycetota bacterium]